MKFCKKLKNVNLMKFCKKLKNVNNNNKKINSILWKQLMWPNLTHSTPTHGGLQPYPHGKEIQIRNRYYLYSQ